MSLSTQSLLNASTGADITLVADSNSSLAMAAFLSTRGHRIKLWTAGSAVPSRLEIRQHQSISAPQPSKLNYNLLSNEPRDVITGATTIILSSPTTTYGALLEKLGPLLVSGQTIILLDAPIGACLEFRRRLSSLGGNQQLTIVETGGFFDFVRVQGDLLVTSFPRARVRICGASRNETRRGLAVAANLWTGLQPASNLLERGLSEAEKIIRPVMRLFHLTSSRVHSLKDISLLLTPGLLSIIHGIDLEVHEIARNYGLTIPDFEQNLRDYYGAVGLSLKDTLASLSERLFADDDTLSEELLKCRLQQETADTFVLLDNLSGLGRTPAPIIESVIELSSTVVGSDLRKEGRALADLGLVGYDIGEITDIMNA